MLLAAGADPNASAEGGLTPMHVAVGGNDLATAKLLIDVADLNARALGETPLEVAAKVGSHELRKLLLDAVKNRPLGTVGAQCARSQSRYAPLL